MTGNYASFASNEYKKAIYTKSRFRNKFLKNPNVINRKLCKEQRNDSIERNSIKHYFANIRSKRVISRKLFWKAIKRFLTNRGCL